MSGIECLQRLRQMHPPFEGKVLMLTGWEESELVLHALQAGASGYLLKDKISPAELWVTIQDASLDQSVMSPGIAQKLLAAYEKLAGGGVQNGVLSAEKKRC